MCPDQVLFTAFTKQFLLFHGRAMLANALQTSRDHSYERVSC